MLSGPCRDVFLRGEKAAGLLRGRLEVAVLLPVRSCGDADPEEGREGRWDGRTGTPRRDSPLPSLRLGSGGRGGRGPPPCGLVGLVSGLFHCPCLRDRTDGLKRRNCCSLPGSHPPTSCSGPGRVCSVALNGVFLLLQHPAPP